MNRKHLSAIISLGLAASLPVAVMSTAVAQELEERVERLEQGQADGAYGLNIGGALRYQYAYRNFDDGSEDRLGDYEFDTFRLNFDGEYEDLIFSAEYRFYRTWDSLKHGWIGYNFNDNLQGRLGLDQVPFGLLPYQSHSFFFSSNYYVGLEDNYKSGLTLDWQRDDLEAQFGFYKNAGFGGGGNATDPGRYSYDIVVNDEDDQFNEETNQFNLRTAYTMGEEGNTTEVGLSGQWGQLYNQSTEDMGDFWAAGAHVRGNYGPWEIMLQGARYQYNPENPAGIDEDTVQVGAYDFFDLIPAGADTYLAHVAYNQPVNLGPISHITWYANTNWVANKDDDSEDTQMHILGASITAGKVFTYVDIVRAQNQPFIGDSMVGDERWNTRFNINVGYYF